MNVALDAEPAAHYCIQTMRFRDSGAAPLRVFVYDPLDHPVDWLEQLGVEVTLGVPLHSTGQRRQKWDPPALVAAAAGHDALLGASGAVLGHEVLEQLPSLRCISKLGIGHEVIDLEAATELGVMVTNTPVHSEVDVVAEHALALVLGLMKQLHFYNAAYLAAGGWRSGEHKSRSLRGATAGVIGLGQIGCAVAARLRAFGARVIGTDVRQVDLDGLVEQVGLEALLEQSDVVTLHAPGRSAKEPPLLDRARLGLLRHGALLVNTARGNLVDQAAVVEMLADGRLAGFAADVYDPEPPPPDEPLLVAPNVLLTPHAAAWNADLRHEMVQLAMENVWTVLTGGVPEHLLNPGVLEARTR